MPPIVHDYEAIKKALLGDTWWEPAKPKPKEPMYYNGMLIREVESIDALQDPRANPGRTVEVLWRIRFSEDLGEGVGLSRSLTPITSFTVLDPTR